MGPLLTWLCYPPNWCLTSLSVCLSHPMLCWHCSLYTSQEFRGSIWIQGNFTMELCGVSSGQYTWLYALISICHKFSIIHQWKDRFQYYVNVIPQEHSQINLACDASLIFSVIMASLWHHHFILKVDMTNYILFLLPKQLFLPFW